MLNSCSDQLVTRIGKPGHTRIRYNGHVAAPKGIQDRPRTRQLVLFKVTDRWGGNGVLVKQDPRSAGVFSGDQGDLFQYA
jgi:hypothetical protein